MTQTLYVGTQSNPEERTKSKIERAVLVYQGGIANVFAVESFNMADFGRNARRLMQSDFRDCESFARGLAAAGTLVASAHCNMCGDVTHQPWSDEVDSAVFRDNMRPVWAGVAA